MIFLILTLRNPPIKSIMKKSIAKITDHAMSIPYDILLNSVDPLPNISTK